MNTDKHRWFHRDVHFIEMLETTNAPQGLNVSNRRWSEQGERNRRTASPLNTALQGLNILLIALAVLVTPCTDAVACTRGNTTRLFEPFFKTPIISKLAFDTPIKLELADTPKTPVPTEKLPVHEIGAAALRMPEPKNDFSLVKEKLTALLESVKLIESRQIKDYDFSNLTYTKVSPPMERNATGSVIVHNSGTHPSTIKDPVLRKEYEDAIAKNNAHAATFNEQWALKIRKESLVNHVKVFVLNRGKPEERAIVVEMIKQSGLRQDTIAAMLEEEANE